MFHCYWSCMSSCSNAAVNTVDYSPHALIMTIDFALAVNARSASLGHCSTVSGWSLPGCCCAQPEPIGRRSRSEHARLPAASQLWREPTKDVPFAHSCPSWLLLFQAALSPITTVTVEWIAPFDRRDVVLEPYSFSSPSAHPPCSYLTLRARASCQDRQCRESMQ